MDLIICWRDIWARSLRARTARSQRGASLVEYALLAALIAVVCIVAISFIGTSVKSTFTSVGSSIKSP